MTGSAQQDTGIPLGGWVAEGNRGKKLYQPSNCSFKATVFLYKIVTLYPIPRFGREKNIKQTIQNRAISSSQQVNYEVKITPKTAMGQIKKRKIKSCKIELFVNFIVLGKDIVDERWKFYTLVVEEYGTEELIRGGKTWLSHSTKRMKLLQIYSDHLIQFT